jgi:hypothetical protein
MGLEAKKNIEKLRDFLSDNYKEFDEMKFDDLSVNQQLHLAEMYLQCKYDISYFYLRKDLKKHLIHGKVTETIRSVLEKKGIILSDNAVSAVVNENTWEIIDGNITYRIEDLGGKLHLEKRETLPNLQLKNKLWKECNELISKLKTSK